MPYADPIKRREMARIYTRRYRENPNARRRQKIYDATRHANERAQRNGVLGRLRAEEVQALFDAHPTCAYCGRSDRLELDHVIPLSHGGMNRPENIVIACRWCNADKHQAVHPTRWANKHLACIECGTTERPHICHGRCRTCHNRVYAEQRRARRARKKAA